MKKKLLSLLALAALTCLPMTTWAQDKVYVDVNIAPASGNINDAIKAAVTDAGGDAIRNLTITLLGEAYTVNETITAGGNIFIFGNSEKPAVITMDDEFTGNFITLDGSTDFAKKADGTDSDHKLISSVMMTGVKIAGLKGALVKDAQKTLVEKLTISFSDIEMPAAGKNVLDFNSKGYVGEVIVSKSTIWANGMNTGFFAQYGSRPKNVNEALLQQFDVQNSTFVNIANDKNFCNFNQKGTAQNFYTIRYNIFVNCGKQNQVVVGFNAGQTSATPVWDVDGNAFNWGGLDVSAAEVEKAGQKDGADIVKNSIPGVIAFTDAAAGDFNSKFVPASDEVEEPATLGDPRWTCEFAYAPTDIMIAPESGDITKALAEATAKVKKVGNISIWLTGEAYFLSGTITTPGDLVIAGDIKKPAVITVDGDFTGDFVTLDGTTTFAKKADGTDSDHKLISSVMISDVKISGLKGALVTDAQKTLLENLDISSADIEMPASNKNVLNFNGKGYVGKVVVNKSTIWANGMNTGFFAQYGSRPKNVNGDWLQEFDVQNSTIVNIANGKNICDLKQNGTVQNVYTIKNNIFVDCGKQNQVVVGFNKGQASATPVWDVDGNVFNWGGLDVSAAEVTKAGKQNEEDIVRNSIAGVVTFTDAAAGDFNAQLGIPTVPETPTVVVGDPRWTVSLAQVPSNIVINDEDITDGDLSAAITAKTTGLIVGDMTINLAGKAYTVNASITAGGSVAINGAEGATIDASALSDGSFILMSTTPAVEANSKGSYMIDNLTIKDVTITGIPSYFFYDNNKKYVIQDLTVDNCVLALATKENTEGAFEFKAGGVMNFTIQNSTVYQTGAANVSYFTKYNNSIVPDNALEGYSACNFWTYKNNTFYGVGTSQWHNGGRIAQKASTMTVDIENNIWYDCADNILRRMFAQKSFSTFVEGSVLNKNTFWKSATGAEDQGNYGNGSDLTTDPGFKDAAAGDFTVDAASLQALYKTGDPRWLVEFTGVQLVTTAASGYTTLVSKYPLDFTSAGELKAYVVAAATDVDATAKTVKLTAITEAAANTPVILYGEKSTDYTITAKADAAAVENNLLKGDATKDATLADDEAYLLKDGKFGLCTAGTLPAGKAYLPATTSGARELVIVFDGDATGIDDVTRDALENGKIYNLQGQEVKKAGKGIFIINGKKVVIK